MKLKNNLIKESHKARFLYNRSIKTILILSTLIIMGIQMPVQAQETEETAEKQIKPSWWFGAAAGANFNFYNGSTQQLNDGYRVPVAFHEGMGIGLYLAPLVEFYRPGSRWGFMFQFGYDNRKGDFDEVFTPCDCPANLSTNLNYLTVEPSLRFAPFRSGFYLFAGPRFAYNLDKSFVFQQGTNPAYPEQIQDPEVTGDFSNVNETLISMQVGAGYDIPISSQSKRTQLVLSPFVSFHPYYGQDPRSIETWNITTVRAGAALKFGVGKKTKPEVEKEKEVVAAPIPEVDFTVHSPENIPAERMVRETFPIRNYVFFDLGSTKISNRYVLLKKEQVADFKEEQVELYTPENFSGRSARQMVVYYNILNILGDRMGKNPSSTIKLVGSSETSAQDGREMAESVKTYLVDVFGISPSRISTEGRDKPKIPSQQPGQTEDLALLKEGDRRVSIESNSPALLMEFQSGPNAPLKPVELVVLDEAPIESYVTFDNAGASEAFSSWSLEIKDDDGKIQYFGPYTQDKVSIPGKSILGQQPEGKYKVKMIGITESGKTVEKETTVNMVLWTPPKNEEAMRFSVIYEFDESKAIGMYDKYLTEVVMPAIPVGAKVIIHGYTDMIGDANHNKNLSLQRANDVRKTLENALTNAGRNDVRFEVYGFGEERRSALFGNKYPEERSYNRAVLIDVIPQ